MELVSVIIPTFNRTKFLAQTIESVLEQTYSCVEILLINDGSDAECVFEIKKIAKSSDKIKLYNLTSHGGVSQARNLGLEKATGDYIFFLDDDDFIPNNLFEIAIEELSKKKEISAIVFLFDYFLEPDYKEKIPTPIIDYRQMQEELATMPFSTFLSCCPPIHTFFVRKTVVSNERFSRELFIGEDWYFWLRLAYRGCNFELNKKANVYYRKHLQSSIIDKEKFFTESMRVLFKLEQEKMLKNRQEKFLLNAKAFAFCLRAKKITAIKYLLKALLYPNFAIKYFCWFLSYWVKNKIFI